MSWPTRFGAEVRAAGAAALVGLAALLWACARGPALAPLGPPPVLSIEPGPSFESRRVTLRVDSLVVGGAETLLFLTVQNRSPAWVETRALRGSQAIAAGQTLRARGVEGLEAGSPGVVAPGETARGRVRFPPLPAGSLGLRLSLPLELEGDRLEAQFLVRMERGWQRP